MKRYRQLFRGVRDGRYGTREAVELLAVPYLSSRNAAPRRLQAQWPCAPAAARPGNGISWRRRPTFLIWIIFFFNLLSILSLLEFRIFHRVKATASPACCVHPSAPASSAWAVCWVPAQRSPSSLTRLVAVLAPRLAAVPLSVPRARLHPMVRFSPLLV